MLIRRFPIGPSKPRQKHVDMPVNAQGEPDRDSLAWRTMIADAAARPPDKRSPAEVAALRSEMPPTDAMAARLESARALGARAADKGFRASDNPFVTGIFKAAWEQGRSSSQASSRYAILVRYRTKSGCNAKSVAVVAPNIETALRLAGDKVRRQRGVIRIDTCQYDNPERR